MLGVITVTAAIPGLLCITLYISLYEASLLHWLAIEKLITAFFCFAGGGLLIKGNKWGYPVALLGWILIFWASTSSVAAALQPETSARLRTNMLLKEGVYFLAGLPTALILIRDMMKTRKV